MIGQLVGNYKIEEKLGEGGMGAVYKGVDTMLDREVAIKALRPELASQTSVVERFRSEAVTLAKLNHPNIASLYTMFRQGDELYMVLEFVRGETLDSIIQRRGAMPAEEIIPVFSQILDGIDHAHELGIVHRDIKPANMMLTENGKLKVLDFGIARLLGSARMTRAGNIIGTLEYMAPEQVKGQDTDGRSDIYALGMMLYEILTGQLPFQTENEFELMKLQTESMPQPPREINPNIPEAVEAAIMQAIQKDPDQRFQTAGEFRETLLDAGFKAQGTMHGITGTHKRPATHPSHPAVSAAGVSKSGENVSTKNEPKPTRLGASIATAPAASNVPKATRLGNFESQSYTTPEVTRADISSESFLSKLKPVHYIGAGVAALLLIGVAAAVPLMLMGGSRSTTVEVNNTIEKTKSSEVQKTAVVDLSPQNAVSHGNAHLGCTTTTLSPEVAQQYKLKNPPGNGTVVSVVESGGPADKAGIRNGDVIVSYNNENVNDAGQLRDLVLQSAPNTTVSIGIWRSGSLQTLNAMLGESLPNNSDTAGQSSKSRDDSPTSNPSTLSPGTGELKPVAQRPDSKPADKSVASKPIEKPAPVAPKPAAPKPAPQKPKSSGGGSSARCALTGDC